MKILFKSLIVLPFALALIFFSLVNRHMVEIETVILSDRLNLPAFLIVIVPLFLGMLIGGFILSLKQISYRLELRRLRNDVLQLKAQEKALRQEIDNLQTQSQDTADEDKRLMIEGSS